MANEIQDGGQKVTTPSDTAVPTFSLPLIVTRFQQANPNGPFKDDGDYLEAIIACETARVVTFQLRADLANEFFRPSSEKMFASFSSNGVQSGLELGKLMMDLTCEIDKRREKKLAATTDFTPLAEKFLESMDASDAERKIFRHVLASATHMLSTRDLGIGSMMWGRSRYRDTGATDCIVWLRALFPEAFSLAELMALVGDSNSKWVKEQVFVRATGATTSISAMSENVVRAFMGAELSLAQYQEIESSVLRKTLLDDSRFQQTNAGKAVLQKQARESLPERGSQTTNDSNEARTPFVDALSDGNVPVSTSTMQSEKIFGLLADAAAKEHEQQLADAEKETSPIITPPETSDTASQSAEADIEFGPYQSDLDYIEDQVQLMEKEAKFEKAKAVLDMDVEEAADAYQMSGYGRARGRRGGAHYLDEYGQPVSTEEMKMEQERTRDKLEIKFQKLRDRIRVKLAATKKVPRLEQLVDALQLQKFEKYVILHQVKKIIMPSECDANMRGMGDTVGFYIEKFATCLEQKMQCRKYFYKSSTLIREGLLSLSGTDFMTDLTKCRVDLDRRMFDFIVGLDTEFSEIVDGSHLYAPSVPLDDVILPKDIKGRVFDCVSKFDNVRDTFAKLELHEKVTYGTGQILLFYGSSGTGKTMLANAIATALKKKVLLVNFPTLGQNTSGVLIKFLFREARISKALLFFDECESLFKSRDKGGSSVNMILTELERFDGLCILATNRPMDLDEAMYRRINLAVEFRRPDHIAREEIWKALHPPKLSLDDDIDFSELARKYELTGGLIKNAWLASIGLMVQRGDDRVTQDDLVKASSEQVVGRLCLEDFDKGVVPTCGIDSVLVDEGLHESLTNIVQYAKAQSVLFGSWGFGKIHRASSGISAMFYGPPGTGKTMAAEAISFDLGKSLMVVNMAELVSKWVGETGKNIKAIFDDAKGKDAVLVFDEAEGLFGKRANASSDTNHRHDNINVGILLQYVENFPGVCIAITNKKSLVDEAFLRRFNFVLHFEQPTAKLREEIFRSMIPLECPLSSDVSFKSLATRYDLCGGDIKSVVFRAATRAALRSGDVCERAVKMADFEGACEDELKKSGERKVANMYI